MDETLRPVHVVYDVALGTQTEVPYTDEEWGEKNKNDADVTARDTAEKEQAANDLELLKNKSAEDPAFAALVRQAGISL